MTEELFPTDLRERVAYAIRHRAYPDGMPLGMWEDMLESKPEDVYKDPIPQKARELMDWWKRNVYYERQRK